MKMAELFDRYEPRSKAVRRYNCYGKDDFGHKYDALVQADPEGTCILAEDALARIVELQKALQEIRDETSVENTWASEKARIALTAPSAACEP